MPSELDEGSSNVDVKSGAAQSSRRSMKLVKKMLGNLRQNELTDLAKGVIVHGTRVPPGEGGRGMEDRKVNGEGRGDGRGRES